MAFLGAFLDAQETWRPADVATVLAKHDLLEGVWESREVWKMRMNWARDLFAICTSHHWGVKFGLYLTVTEHLSKSQIARIAQVHRPTPALIAPSASPCHVTPITVRDVVPPPPQAGSMDYNKAGLPTPRPLCYNPHDGTDSIMVPRVIPSWYSYAPELKALSETHGLSLNANGRIAFQSLRLQLWEMASETARMLGISISELSAQGVELQCAVQTDSARRRTRQFLPAVLKNARLDSQSCFSLRLIGLGIRYKDDRKGFQEVLMPNIGCIEECILQRRVQLSDSVDGPALSFPINMKCTGDFAGVRAIEGQLCGCSREVIHQVPTTADVASIASMQAINATCDNRTSAEIRAIRSHTPLKGETLPRPCDCCTFGHDKRTAAAQLTAFQHELAMLRANETPKGKRDLAKYMRTFKEQHKNAVPGPDGECALTVGFPRPPPLIPC